MKQRAKILAIDLGYSSVKVCYYNESGILTYEKFISAAARIKDPLEPDDEIMFRLCDGDYYVLGSSALKLPKSYLMPLETYDDMRDVYPVWISYLIKKHGGLENIDHIALGLSMAYSDKADDLLNHLYNTLMIDKQNFFFCMPQGLSCKKVYQEFGLDIRENTRHNDARMRNYLIVDGGFNSIDCSTVLDGKASAGAAIGIPNTGVINLARSIQNYLSNTYNMSVSIKEAQSILDSGGIFQRRGREYDISEAVDNLTVEYLKKVLDLIEERFGDSLDTGLEGLLVCGGLGWFFKKYLDNNDQRVIDIISSHFPPSYIRLPVTDCEYMNCVSYLRILEQKLGLEK